MFSYLIWTIPFGYGYKGIIWSLYVIFKMCSIDKSISSHPAMLNIMQIHRYIAGLELGSESKSSKSLSGGGCFVFPWWMIWWQTKKITRPIFFKNVPSKGTIYHFKRKMVFQLYFCWGAMLVNWVTGYCRRFSFEWQVAPSSYNHGSVNDRALR